MIIARRFNGGVIVWQDFWENRFNGFLNYFFTSPGQKSKSFIPDCLLFSNNRCIHQE